MTQPLTLREARFRTEPPMTQEQLAERSGVDQTYISLIERGLRTPSEDIKNRLAAALGIAPSELSFAEPQPGSSVYTSRDSSGQSVCPTPDRRSRTDRRAGADRRQEAQ